MSRRETKEPGTILRYRARPRHRGEILCHNFVPHYVNQPHGQYGFRYFVCARGAKWTICPCGWRPELGVHYAHPEHVKSVRKHGNALHLMPRGPFKRIVGE